MITYNGNEVSLEAGDRKLREATIRWPSGKVRVVGVHQLRGTKGGAMEVAVAWSAACRKSEAIEKERAPKRLAYAANGPRRGSTQVDP